MSVASMTTAVIGDDDNRYSNSGDSHGDGDNENSGGDSKGGGLRK